MSPLCPYTLKEVYGQDLRKAFTKKGLDISRHWAPFLHIQNVLLKYAGGDLMDGHLDFVYLCDTLCAIMDGSAMSENSSYLRFADSSLFYLSFFPSHFDRAGLNRQSYRDSASGAYRKISGSKHDAFYMLSMHFSDYEQALAYLKNRYFDVRLSIVR